MLKAAAVLAAAVVLIGCGGKPDSDSGEAAAVTPVQVATAKLGTIQDIITAEAILYPLRQANIVPKISAPVQKFYAQRGDHVHEGQLLAVLEDKDLQASAQESKNLYEQAQASYENTRAAIMPDDLTKAKADVDAARQALDAAQKVYESREQLFKEGALARKLVDDSKVALVQAQSTYDTAQQHLNSLESVGRPAQLKTAQAQMDAAKAHYEAAEAQVSYSEVRSPITGVVSDRGVNIGEMASTGSALFSIVDISQVVARANIPVHEAADISLGRPATITGPGAELKGKVTVISPAVDPNTTTVEVWVEAPNPGEKLKLGVTARISINAGEVQNAVLVPVAALLASDEGGEKVMLAGADGLAHESKVETGIRQGDDVQIASGVKAGDKVIVQGALGLDDKSKIEIMKPGAAEPGAGEDRAK
jgi:multidrug efflux pump subunit AcrA (membrane-fusion protein)